MRANPGRGFPFGSAIALTSGSAAHSWAITWMITSWTREGKSSTCPARRARPRSTSAVRAELEWCMPSKTSVPSALPHGSRAGVGVPFFGAVTLCYRSLSLLMLSSKGGVQGGQGARCLRPAFGDRTATTALVQVPVDSFSTPPDFDSGSVREPCGVRVWWYPGAHAPGPLFRPGTRRRQGVRGVGAAGAGTPSGSDTAPPRRHRSRWVPCPGCGLSHPRGRPGVGQPAIMGLRVVHTAGAWNNGTVTRR